MPAASSSARYAVNLHAAASTGDIQTVKAFLQEAPFDLNKGDSAFGWTPLHLAVKYEHSDVVLALVENKAILGLPDKKKMSPIEWAERKMSERKLGVPEVDSGSVLMGVSRGSLEEQACARNVAEICNTLFGYTRVGHAFYMAAAKTATGEAGDAEDAMMEAMRGGWERGIDWMGGMGGLGGKNILSVHGESEGLRLARAHGNPEALKILLLTAHEESVMHALKGKIKRLDFAAEPSPASVHLCTFMLQVAVLNQRPFPRVADLRVTPGGERGTRVVSVEIEMMEAVDLDKVVHVMRMPGDTSIAECLLRALTMQAKIIKEDWKNEFASHGLFLRGGGSGGGGGEALDILSPLDLHTPLVESSGGPVLSLECKLLPGGAGENYATVSSWAEARQSLRYAMSTIECTESLARAASLPRLEVEAQACRERLAKVEMFEQSADAKAGGVNCGNCAAAECNMM